jgi:peptidyl-dipeptidase A
MKQVIYALLILLTLGCAPARDAEVQGPEIMETPSEFLARSEKEMLELGKEVGLAHWVRATYITPDTGELAARASERALAFDSALIAQAKKLKDVPTDAESARAIELILRGSSMPAPNDPKLRAELAKLATDLEGLYGAGKACDENGENCKTLPELENILAASRDYDEQLQAWLAWRGVSPPMRPMYQRFAELMNQGARELGYADLGEQWKGGYDLSVPEFEAESKRLWGQVEPLYEALHCHVRNRLSDHYGQELVPAQGPIPAHLLGNMWAQSWSNLYDLLEPYPGVAPLDVTAALKSQDYDAVRMTETAEAFFTSLGLPELPDSFWERSMLVAPTDHDAVCHASAWDLDNGNDPRIKQCVEANEEQLITLHHELGHIYYYLMYKELRPLFKGGAHDGFHEAIGDTIVLSMTPGYLQEKGLVDVVAVSEEAVINQQMKLALDKIAFLPFGKLIDEWRWKVFSGEIPESEYNAGWWSLRESYQGIRPPVPRSEADFDPGAKYHIPGNTPYTRYFLSHVMQFQFHRALCDAAGYTGPLHDCSIYNSKEAGSKLGAMLAMGASKPWPVAMEALTGQPNMDAAAIIDYFQPLMAWLNEQNADRQCGW